MQNKKGMRCHVKGRVQGVWFRASTQKTAVDLGITGWVRNLPDGRVEVLAFGDAENIEKLLQWLHQGPELAKVDEVLVDDVPWEVHERFAVK